MNWIRYKSGRAKTFPSTERVSELLRQRCEEHGRLEVKARPARARTRNAGNVPAAARIIPKQPRVPHLSTDHARRAGRRAAQRIALPFILSLQPANTQLPSLFSFRRRGEEWVATTSAGAPSPAPPAARSAGTHTKRSRVSLLATSFA
jgi:hypothetical protein